MPKVEINPLYCKGCRLCVGACPKGVLDMGDMVNDKGYRVALDRHPDACTGCAMCAVICPDSAISV